MALPTSGTIDPADWEAEFDAVVTDITDDAFREVCREDFAFNNTEGMLIIPVVGFDVSSASDFEFWFTSPDTLIVAAVWVYGCDTGATSATLTATITGELTPDLVRQGDGYTLSGSTGTPTTGVEQGARDEVFLNVGVSVTPNENCIMLRKGQLYKVNIASNNAGAVERASCYILCHANRRVD